MTVNINYGPGPWDLEPDDDEFTVGFAPKDGVVSTYHCLLYRSPLMGNWCGYVAMPRGHRWWGDEDPIDADAHGGITFAGTTILAPMTCLTEYNTRDNWWLGFDCGHGLDVIPAMPSMYLQFNPNAVYRDYSYSRAAAARLARSIWCATQPCDRPPQGWECSRRLDHDGPCAARPSTGW